MQFGVTMFPADYAMRVTDLGRAAEDRGFESLFLPEHTHIPVHRETPWSGTTTPGDPPREYVHTIDPFVAFGAVAAVTSRIKLGTGICLVIQRDPILLAKEVASIDLLSGGRFLFGVGAGWLREEIANHGTDPRTRWRLFGERMRAMEAIWSNEEAEFRGKYVNFDKIWSWPKPVQKPRPPILLGGDVLTAMQRVVEYADEWMPHPDRGEVPLRGRIRQFHELCESGGRPPLPVTVYGTPTDQRAVETYVEAGLNRCVFRLPAASADEVLPALDRAA
ncbi:MAG: LLM class F420-dependent oxidoreductase, partial [Chloroflexi bacterium]|nr:LLM class F420-dependent oxidoreductase [Chloroflexota bacterium]